MKEQSLALMGSRRARLFHHPAEDDRMSQENVELARRWFNEVWNERRTDLICELTASECCGYAASGEHIDRDQFTAFHAEFTSAFPDLHIDIESTVAERDEVVVRWTATGSHDGGGFGLEATHRPIEMHGLTWFRVRNGMFVEARDCWNADRMMNELRIATTHG